MFNNYDIVDMPLSLKRNRTMVENFLAMSDLRLDDVDYYAAAVDRDSYAILAGGGFKGDVIKCIAVSEQLRGTGVSQQLISHLISLMNNRGSSSIKVFTKPGNASIFESMGFKTIGRSDKALLLENSLDGITSYTRYLQSLKREGKNGFIVMNANPFTLGHQYLVEKAAAQVDNLYVIVVDEDKSLFTTAERHEMVKQGCSHLSNVIVCKGSSYIISAATFPSYFIKKMDDVASTQINLDLDITATHIAPALAATVRFVGSEPNDNLTQAYNKAMHQRLPQRGIDVVELPRLEVGGSHVSASQVRNLLINGNYSLAQDFVPATTRLYLVAWLAINALQQELDLTPKPGLVDTHDSGAHTDMDYNTMQRSITALRPYFNQLAVISSGNSLPAASELKQLGILAEKAMLSATCQVNTHRGALFSMGLAVVAACHVLATQGHTPSSFLDRWQHVVSSIAASLPGSNNSHGNKARVEHHVMGALDFARDGYQQLITQWLDFFQRNSNDEHVKHKTLLLIMCSLDDTNVIHRVGYDMAQQVKRDAQHLLENFSIDALKQMNERFITQHISPGGAADMLSLTIFLSSLIS